MATVARHCPHLEAMQALRHGFYQDRGDDAREAVECMDTAIALYVHTQPFYHHTEDNLAIFRVRH